MRAQRRVIGASVADFVEDNIGVQGHGDFGELIRELSEEPRGRPAGACWAPAECGFMIPVSRRNCDKRLPDNNNYQAR